MKKNLKKIITLCLCGLLTSGLITTAFARTKDIKDTKAENVSLLGAKTIDIPGRTFTYENAPQKLKDEYKANCKSVGVKPSPSDEIFIMADDLKNYGIKESRLTYETYKMSYLNSYIYVSGKVNYYFNINNLTVGYGNTTSGNPVHAVQLLLNTYEMYYGGQVKWYLSVDSIFGSQTNNKLKEYQSFRYLTADGLVGANTWMSFVRDFL